MVALDEVLKGARELYRKADFAGEISLLEETLSAQFAEADADPAALLYAELSRALRTLGRYADCEKCIEKALSLAKSQEVLIEVWNEQGQLFDPMNKHQEAIAVLQNAAKTARAVLPEPSSLAGEVFVSLSLSFYCAC